MVIQAKGDESFHQAQVGVSDWSWDNLATELTLFVDGFNLGMKKREESCASDVSNWVKSCRLLRLRYDDYREICSVFWCLVGRT